MIRIRMSIGDSPAYDTYDKWGLVYLDADERTEAPIKSRDVTTYAEQAGENVDPRTVQDAFDYKVKFLIHCPNKDETSANKVIKELNKSFYTQQDGSDIRSYKRVTIYNDYNRVTISGLPSPIEQPTEFYRTQSGATLDCVVFELTLRVDHPEDCDFDSMVPVDKYSISDVQPLWAGTNNSNGVFWIEDEKLRHVRARLTPNTKITIRTKTYGTAPDYMLVRDGKANDYFFDETHAGARQTFVTETADEIIVNVLADYKDFELIVDRSADLVTPVEKKPSYTPLNISLDD